MKLASIDKCRLEYFLKWNSTNIPREKFDYIKGIIEVILTKDEVTVQQTIQQLESLNQQVSKENLEIVWILGFCYLTGAGVAKNEEQSAVYFRAGLEHRYMFAYWGLGRVYFDGKNKNEKYATELFQLGANLGEAMEQCTLGVCLYKGLGVEVNVEKAVKYVQLSSEQTYAYGQFWLGEFFRRGIGVQKNLIQALELYNLAANQGLDDAQYRLGYCYFFGEGVEKNQPLAVEYFKLAANDGNADALYRLGLCYYDGIVFTKDQKIAA